MEAWDLGLDEYLSGDGVCVIEWADQAAEVFPEDALWINLDYPTIQPAGPVGKLSTGSELADGAETAGTVADGGKPLADGDKTVTADGESLTVRGAPVEPREQEDDRVISLGRHSPRYNSRWRKLAETFPQIEEIS